MKSKAKGLGIIGEVKLERKIIIYAYQVGEDEYKLGKYLYSYEDLIDELDKDQYRRSIVIIDSIE